MNRVRLVAEGAVNVRIALLYVRAYKWITLCRLSADVPLPPRQPVNRYSLLFILLGVTKLGNAQAQTALGGCARGREQGHVRVIRPATLTYWRGGDRAVAVQPGDELRLCRFEGSNAIVTLGGYGVGFRLPREAVSPDVLPASLPDVTPQHIACIAPRIAETQTIRDSDRQDFALLALSRHVGVPLPMIYKIRVAAMMAVSRGEPTTACTQED